MPRFPAPTLRFRSTVLLGLTLLLLAAAGNALCGELAPEVRPASETAVIGRDLVLRIIVPAPEGSSLAAGDLAVTVTSADAETWLGESYPVRPLTAIDDVPLPAGRLGLEWAAPVSAEAAPGAYDLQMKITGRSADAETWTGSWTGTIDVDFGEEWSADRITNFIERRGMGLFLLVVFGFGILMSLSPCIYPMIPITLAVIGSQAQEKGALHGLVMSVTYVLGMALVYAVMGALSATVFSGINAFMQSPAVLVPIAALLLVLSFSMFGAYELEAPRFLRDRLQGGGGGKGGVIGVLAMGMVAGLVASPCVGPFLAALLVWVATTGNWILGFFSLFTFGIGMGLLLIGVGTFPALLGSMPRSGGWMETVRRAMGLLLVAMAFFFVRPGLVLPTDIFLLLVGVTTILVAVFLGAFDSLAAESGWWVRTRKSLGLISFLVGALLLVATVWMMVSPMFLAELSPRLNQTLAQLPTTASTGPATDPAGASVTDASGAAAVALPDKVQWTKIHTGEGVTDFLARQRATAKAAGKPVILDFWAQWCKLCLVLDKKVWTDPAVVAEAQRFTTLKIDATKSDEEMDEIFEEFQVAGLPTIVFIDSRGKVLLGRNSNFKAAPEMLELMQSIR